LPFGVRRRLTFAVVAGLILLTAARKLQRPFLKRNLPALIAGFKKFYPDQEDSACFPALKDLQKR